jgi:hypothetical protein
VAKGQKMKSDVELGEEFDEQVTNLITWLESLEEKGTFKHQLLFPKPNPVHSNKNLTPEQKDSIGLALDMVKVMKQFTREEEEKGMYFCTRKYEEHKTAYINNALSNRVEQVL